MEKIRNTDIPSHLPRDRGEYLQMQDACDIEVGDKVRVIDKATSHTHGWCNTWITEMSDVVRLGTVLTVTMITGEAGIRLSDGMGYPFWVLRKVPF